MRSIAEFIMRGRSQAVMIALLGSWVPILTQATLGLVSLRKGWQEGLLVTLWALLPALVAYWIGDVALTLAFASVAVILVTYFCAIVLRLTVSWPAALSALVALSCLCALISVFAVDNIVLETQEFLEQLVRDVDPEVRKELFDSWTHIWCGGMIGFWISVSAVVGLLVSRWWQALLYNPGGFQKEFHQLRLNNALALVSLVATVYCEFRGKEYGFWAHIFALPLILAGLGLLHCAVAKMNKGFALLIVSYFGLLLAPPLLLVLALAGLTDVWLNYRKRFNLMQ